MFYCGFLSPASSGTLGTKCFKDIEGIEQWRKMGLRPCCYLKNFGNLMFVNILSVVESGEGGLRYCDTNV
jgi:hypothetical protein